MKDALLDSLDEWRWAAGRWLDDLGFELHYGANKRRGQLYGLGAWGAATVVAAYGLVLGPSTANTATFLTLGAMGILGYTFGALVFVWAQCAAEVAMCLGLALVMPQHQEYWQVTAGVLAVFGPVSINWPWIRRRVRAAIHV